MANHDHTWTHVYMYVFFIISSQKVPKVQFIDSESDSTHLPSLPLDVQPLKSLIKVIKIKQVFMY